MNINLVIVLLKYFWTHFENVNKWKGKVTYDQYNISVK